MTRTKKYVAAAAITAAMVGVPTMAKAVTSPVKVTVATTAKTGGSTSAKVSKTASSVRVVAPGERVQAAPGVQLWLTKEGKHWSTPIQANQFRSVIDGNWDLSQPGVSLQSEPVPGRYFLSGIYNGKGDAASVKVVTDKGTVYGQVVHLAGQPGWGAWYAISPLPTGPMNKNFYFVRNVTVQDTAGHTITTLLRP